MVNAPNVCCVNALIRSQLATQLSVAPDDLNAALARLRDEGASLRQNLADAYTRLVVARARELATTSVVQHLLDEDLGADGPRQLAQALAAQGSTAIIGVPGERPQIIVARAADQTFDCGALLRTVLARHGGRGGGRPEQAQGGVPDTAALSAAMAELAAAVEQR